MSSVRHLHGNHRLHDRILRTVFCFRYWRQRLSSRFPSRFSSHILHALQVLLSSPTISWKRNLTTRVVYTNLPAFGKLHLVWPTVILGCLAALVTIPIFVFYWKGPQIRARSKFAQSLATEREAQGPRRRPSTAPPSVAPSGRRSPAKDV